MWSTEIKLPILTLTDAPDSCFTYGLYCVSRLGYRQRVLLQALQDTIDLMYGHIVHCCRSSGVENADSVVAFGA